LLYCEIYVKIYFMVKILIIRRSLVTTEWLILRLQIEEKASDMEGS